MAWVAVVDDEPLIRHVLSEFLGDAGYQVRTFGAATPFLEALEQGFWPDLLLLDLGLPDLTPQAVLRRLRALAGPAPPPVLIISGWPTLELAPELVQGFIAKPFDPSGVLEAVAAWVPLSERPPTEQVTLPHTNSPMARLSLSLPEQGAVVRAMISGYFDPDPTLGRLTLDLELADGLPDLGEAEWRKFIRNYLLHLVQLLDSQNLRVNRKDEALEVEQ